MKNKIDIIWCDLDGVMADFNQGVKALTGKLPNDLHKRDMWKAIARSETFFEDLELMSDALELWHYISNLSIDKGILTGLPTMKNGADQKRRWVAKKLCDQVEVIVLPSKDKHLHAGPNKILIDDRQDMISPWVAAGGIGILHTSTIATIGQLKAFGL